jgi:hypothetical protein
MQTPIVVYRRDTRAWRAQVWISERCRSDTPLWSVVVRGGFALRDAYEADLAEARAQKQGEAQ